MKKILFIGLLSIVIITLIIFSLGNIGKTSNFQNILKTYPSPTPVNVFRPSTQQLKNKISPLEKIGIGATQNQVSNLSTSSSIQGAKTIYSVPGADPLNPDTIIVEEGKVVYEKTSLFTTNAGGFPQLQTFLNNLGTPDNIIENNRYNQTASTYIFASKGVTLVANPVAGVVYEIEQFIPMTLNEYMNTYGKDIPPSSNGTVEN